MEHIITTYGGGELFKLIFDGIAALFKADKTGMIMPLIHIGLLVGSVYMMILMFFKSSLAEGAKWLLWVVVATNLLFLPKTTVWIHDPLMNYKEKVDNVPFALGFFASFVSQIGRAVTEKMESVFSLPDYMPYHKTGTVFASSLMSQVGQFRIVDPVFRGNVDRFINQCIVFDAMIGQKYTLTELQNSNDIWTFVSGHASSILGFLYKEEKLPGVVVTCKEGAEKLKKLWTNEVKKATQIYGSRVQNRSLTSEAFFTDLITSANMLSQSKIIATNAENILRQEMMINAIQDSSNNKLSELGVAANYTATKALLQQRSAYAAAGAIAAKTLPLFKNVIEALSYGLFIFIVVLALMPNGYRVLTTYFGILIWTQLWAPLYALLNLIMSLYGSKEGLRYGLDKGLTLLNSSAIINVCADMTTLAAWLSVSIPFISYGILKQGAAAFVGLAQHLGSAMQSAASGAAAETVSGNISLGNVTMGTQAYQNTTAFQHNTSPTYNASQFKSMGASGIEKNTFADGTQSFNDQAMSHLSVQIIGTENTSFAKQTSLNSAKSIVESKSTAATQATEASLQTSTNFLSHVSKSMGTESDLSKTVGASQAKTLQGFNSYVEDIRQSNNLTETQAREVAIAAKAGLEVAGFGGSISGSLSDTKAFQKALDSAKSIARQKNYSDSMEQIMSAAKSYSEKQDDGRLAELGTSATASLNQASSLRQEVSVAQNQIDTISKDLSSTDSKSFSVSKVLDQEFLTFMAHQPANAGPTGEGGGKMGYDRARHIYEKGGAERDAYLAKFQEANPQYAIQVLPYVQKDAALTQQYDTQASQIRNQTNLDQQNSQSTQEVLKQGKTMGLTLNNTPIPSVERPKPETQEAQQNSSTEKAAQGAENVHSVRTLQNETTQRFQAHEVGLTWNHAQSTQEAFKQSNNVEPTFNNTSPSSVEGAEQRRQDEQQNLSMGNAAQSAGNSQLVIDSIHSQGEFSQIPQTFNQEVTHQGSLAQNHTQNAPEALKQGNDIGLAPHNALTSSVESPEKGRQSEQQNSSTANAVKSEANSQSATTPQGGFSQIPQTFNQEVAHQGSLAQNHVQNTPEILKQGNDIGLAPHNALTSSVESPEKGRQSEQQNSSTENAVQSQVNSQSTTTPQDGFSQISQTFKQKASPQANLAQNHVQNTRDVLKQSNDMGLASNNTLTSLQNQVKQQNPSMQKNEQSTQNAQPAAAPQAETPQKPQIFKEEVSEFFKKVDSHIKQGQGEIAQHEKEHQEAKKKLEKTPPKVSSIRTDLHIE